MKVSVQESSRRKLSENKDHLSDCAKKGIAGELHNSYIIIKVPLFL